MQGTLVIYCLRNIHEFLILNMIQYIYIALDNCKAVFYVADAINFL